MSDKVNSAKIESGESVSENISLTTNQKIVGIFVFVVTIVIGILSILNSPLPARNEVSSTIQNYLLNYREGTDLSAYVSDEYIEMTKIKDHTKLGAAQLNNLETIQINSVKATVDDVYYRATGTATYTDGYSAPVEAYMKKENNQWKIMSVEIDVDWERIQNAQAL